MLFEGTFVNAGEMRKARRVSNRKRENYTIFKQKYNQFLVAN